ncbi:hypothetical protein BDZ94DRAFT_1249815 [Collybia nuda]|uniref:Uncharacterized protein n=1 Tax=Collybia nuda TaxID=64659 RepID=A0A9P5YG19_9AGAR|nr:hypothetical protein BDZ94DRAFT_1249815 [Collybia nuda]
MQPSVPMKIPVRQMSTQGGAPASLTRLLKEPTYSTQKLKLEDQRKKFKDDPNAISDLKAYENSDENHEFVVLKGLISPAMVGTEDPTAPGHIWKKTDTFFTDFEKWYPHRVISQSADSLIICNLSSHDTRQYTSEVDPEGKDKQKSAGMSYFHFLVIPRQKVYNIVSVDDTNVIQEMISHFESAWNDGQGAPKFIEAIDEALDRRAKAVLEGYKAEPSTVDKRTEEFEKIMITVREDAATFAQKLVNVKHSDFVHGFHAAPDASIGHLHMHVILAPSEFRIHSTGEHDWKTIPARAAMAVIRWEKTRAFFHGLIRVGKA